jgi:predicted nucleic acid-binding Zn ribbon protein
MTQKRGTNDTFTPIGTVLDTILERCRADSAGGIAYLGRIWDAAVGAPICDNARPFAVKGSLLLVHVSSSVWLHQLRFLKAEILEKLNRGLAHGKITDIKFKIGAV